MAITITSEQYYKDGVAQTTPAVHGDNTYTYAGMNRLNNTPIRYVLLLTCKTTVPISSLTLSLTCYGSDNTDSTKYLGMYVTTTKNNTYLTDSTGGDTKLRFSTDCTDGGSFVANNKVSLARGTVTKNIPTGTFYIYIVPYQTNVNNYCTIRSIQMTDNGAPTATGTSITIYKATLNNQSATSAGTSAIWYAYNAYMSPYYYYSNSTCSTGLVDSKITVPSKTGYTFKGYCTGKNGDGTQYVLSTGVITNNLYKVNENKTLYAWWVAKTFKVTFNANGGTTPTANKTVTYASTYGTLPTPTRTGYTFSGWYTATSGGSKIESTTTVSITAAQTLYARWTGNQYTLTVNPNGGALWNGSSSALTVTPNLIYGAGNWTYLSGSTRPGYTFTGYYTAPSGGEKVYNADGTFVSGGTYWNSDGTYKATSNLTVYAQWSADGLAYIDNGSKCTACQISIENGVKFDTYQPYIEDGIKWYVLS